MRSEGVGVERHAAPAQRREALAAHQRVDARLQRRRVGSLACGEEEDAHGELVVLGQAAAGSEEARKEGPIHAEKQTGTVAGAFNSAASVLEAAESAEGELDDFVRRRGRIRDGPDATSTAPGVLQEMFLQLR